MDYDFDVVSSFLGTDAASSLNLQNFLIKLNVGARGLKPNNISILISREFAETFSLRSDQIQDLLYELCTSSDSFNRDRIDTLMKWLTDLNICDHPNAVYPDATSGYIKCIASILWHVHASNLLPDVVNVCTPELFEQLFKTTQSVKADSPLKAAFESLFASYCYIRPGSFNRLLSEMNVLSLSPEASATNDDNKQHECKKAKRQGKSHTPFDVRLSASQLQTIAMACQSPVAVKELMESGLLKVFTSAIHDFSKNPQVTSTNPLLNILQIIEILKFFTTISFEGDVRDWLGSHEPSRFWEPLLTLLCNNKLDSDWSLELENALINFLVKVTSCHSNNQDALTIILLSVIRTTVPNRRNINIHHESSSAAGTSSTEKNSMSEFTRQLIVKVLLNVEKVVVNVTSELPLLRNGSKESTYTSDHPSMQPNSRNLFFLTSIDTKVSQILDKAITIFSTVWPSSMNASVRDCYCWKLRIKDWPDVVMTDKTTIAQVLATLSNYGHSLSSPCIRLETVCDREDDDMDCSVGEVRASDADALKLPLQIFSIRGGLSLLASYIPTVFPDQAKQAAATATMYIVPQHSLAAFGLFLKLPAYAEALLNESTLQDKVRAHLLLRLILGVTSDDKGGCIYSLPIAPSLATFPFEVLYQLLDSSALTTDEGILIRRMVVEVGAIHLVLNCLGIIGHHESFIASGPESLAAKVEAPVQAPKNVQYFWAKGTGYGTGSTGANTIAQQAQTKLKAEEDQVIVLLQIISSYVNPLNLEEASDDEDEDLIDQGQEQRKQLYDIPPLFIDLLQQSCLIRAVCSYLRNDSVFDINRHVPLYQSILKLLQTMTTSAQLAELLFAKESENSTSSVAGLFSMLKSYIDAYLQTCSRTLKTEDSQASSQEDLTLLISDLEETELKIASVKAWSIDAVEKSKEAENAEMVLPVSLEEKYLEVMKKLQFGTYEMIEETANGFRFKIPHHFESALRSAGDRGLPARVKRLAQESVTLSSSLPLSFSSTVFVFCDTDRIDVMKVLITGPADTPYANGCFEFDVYFPPTYPNIPMMINLMTTGRHQARFNPNLYECGKVCLSVLNTWNGSPEEKWNAQTSSLLQVLVSIQSLILVPDPYFNEPGFEASRGKPNGDKSSKAYNDKIELYCVKFAILEQLRNPCLCFKDIIRTHFWFKREEIIEQIQTWITKENKFNVELSKLLVEVKKELSKLEAPEGLEYFGEASTSNQ